MTITLFNLWPLSKGCRRSTSFSLCVPFAVSSRSLKNELYEEHVELAVPLCLPLYPIRILFSTFIHSLLEKDTSTCNLTDSHEKGNQEILRLMIQILYTAKTGFCGVERWLNDDQMPKISDDFYIGTQNKREYLRCSRSA